MASAAHPVKRRCRGPDAGDLQKALPQDDGAWHPRAGKVRVRHCEEGACEKGLHLPRDRHRAKVQSCEAPIPEQPIDEGPEPEDIVLDREAEREIWDLIKAEPLPSYQAFTLYYGLSVPTGEIAKELGLSEDAVRKRLSRTRARLRRYLSERTNVSEAERKGVSHE